MPTPLTILGFYRNDAGTADYGAAQARTDGSWHLVRKQYGNNYSLYNFARFTVKADFQAALANFDSAPWRQEPYSSVDYTLLLQGLTSPIPASTADNGATVASTGGAVDTSSITQAIGQSNTILGNMLAGQNSPGSRASETTLLKLLAALTATLRVGIDGQVSVANFPTSFSIGNLPTKYWLDTQPISAAALPLPAGAATASLQTTGNGLLGDVKTLLSGALSFTLPTGAATAQGQADQLAKLEALRLLLAGTLAVGLPTGASTAALQTAGNTTLASLDNRQTIANGYLATLAQLAGPQVASNFNLVSLAGNNAKAVRTGPTWLLGGTVTNTASAFRYLMLYDSATAPITASVPVLVLAIEPGRTVAVPVPAGRYLAFPTGLAVAGGTLAVLGTLTTTVAVLGTSTGLTAGDLVLNLSFTS